MGSIEFEVYLHVVKAHKKAQKDFLRSTLSTEKPFTPFLLYQELDRLRLGSNGGSRRRLDESQADLMRLGDTKCNVLTLSQAGSHLGGRRRIGLRAPT